MAIFKYKAISKNGKEFIGLLAKKDKYSAKKYLEGKGLFICRLSSDNHLSRRVNESDLIEFFMHLLFQIKCDIPFHKSIESYINIAKNEDFATVICNISNAINSGVSISIAFRSEEKYFGHVVVCILKSAELSGKLIEALEHIIYFLKAKFNVKKKIKGALFYPIIVFFISLIACFICLHNLIPQTVELYDDQLKNEHQILTNIYFFLIEHSTFIIYLFLLLGLFLISLAISERYRAKLVDIFSKIPIFRSIKYKLFEWNFCTIFYAALKSNLSIINIIDILHVVFLHADKNIDFLKCKKDLLNGISLSQTLNSICFISKQSLSIIDVGAQSNNLTRCFFYLSEYLSKNLEDALKRLSLKLGIFVTVTTGIMLIAIILCIVAPIYDNLLLFGE